MNGGPSTRFARDLVSDYSSGELRDPDYQREYVWTEKQAKHFLQRTLSLGHVLGVITTYQLHGGAASFLQDGKQRVTTLTRAIKQPGEYGLTKDDADRLRTAQVSQQSMVYESHDEARQDFQHLNSGVGLIPYEKYRGDLECDEIGKALYEKVRRTVHELSVDLAGVSRSTEPARKKAGQLHRHSLGLFYQFATGHKKQTLYAQSERSIDDQIESLVRAWLDKNQDGWSREIDRFICEIERINAVLREKTSPHPAKKWDLVAVRGLYAAKIYCSNLGCPSDTFSELVDWYVSKSVRRKTWAGRFDVEHDGTFTAVRINQRSISWLNKINEVGGPAIVERKRVQNLQARAGYHNSHIISHADGGNETIIEPGIPNMSRGRKPMFTENN